MTTGLIVNPRSGKNGGKGVALADELKRRGARLPVAVLDTFAELPAALARMADAGVTTLAISSGDGTIQAIQTHLAEDRIFATAPELMLLPHGTTNMTAATLGLMRPTRARAISLLTDAAALTAAARTRRHTLRVANPADGRPRHGMFTGTGAIWRATRFCQDAIHGTGLRGDAATFATLASAIILAMTGSRAPEAERIVREWPLTLEADGITRGPAHTLFALVTTLDRLILGTRPFWGGHSAPLRATVMPFPPPAILRWLIPCLTGGEDRRVPPGAVSLCAKAITITGRTPFVIDGEFFDPPTDGRLRIETGMEFTYVRG